MANGYKGLLNRQGAYGLAPRSMAYSHEEVWHRTVRRQTEGGNVQDGRQTVANRLSAHFLTQRRLPPGTALRAQVSVAMHLYRLEMTWMPSSGIQQRHVSHFTCPPCRGGTVRDRSRKRRVA